jgi:hypothetical protein
MSCLLSMVPCANVFPDVKVSREDNNLQANSYLSNGYVNGTFSLASPRVRSIGSTARVSAADADWPGAHRRLKQNQARIADEIHEQIIVASGAVQRVGNCAHRLDKPAICRAVT